MANFIYGAVSLTGGTTGSLDSIDGTGLGDGDACIVFTGTTTYVYALDETSGAAENSPEIIAPDTNAGDKRWNLLAARAADVSLDTSSFDKILSSNEDDVQKALDHIDDMHNTDDFRTTGQTVSLVDDVVKSVSGDSGSVTPSGHAFTISGGNRTSTSGSGSALTISSETNTATKTSAYPMTANDDFIIGDTSGGGFQITLPAANAKDMVRIAKKSNSNTLTIARAGSDTIEGNTSISMTAEYSTVVLVSDGVSTWYEM